MNHRLPKNGTRTSTRFRKFAGSVIAITMLTSFLTVSPVLGQTQVVSNNRTIGERGSLRGEYRNREFESLAKQAMGLEQHYSLIKNVIKAVGPSVVHIEAKKRQKSSGGNRNNTSFIEEAGSGIILGYKNANYVITNFHVVENSQVSDIRLEVDGRWFFPTRIVNDRESDLSLLFIDQPDLVAARIGNSSNVEIGDFVVAVGSPFGLSHSVSYGIVSVLGRRDLELGPQGVRYQDFIQTDAAINPGNSGGPLINLRGEVIGINTAIASNSGGSDGIGFSIPIEMVTKIAKDLIDHGRVIRGFLGVSLDARFTPRRAISMGLPQPNGARVSAITPGSPAYGTDIKIGDIVLEFDGEPIANDSHLVTEVSLTPIGQEVTLTVYRDGQRLQIPVDVGNRETFAATSSKK